MRDNALTWIIILTALVGIGIVSIGFYMYIDEIMRSFFFR